MQMSLLQFWILSFLTLGHAALAPQTLSPSNAPLNISSWGTGLQNGRLIVPLQPISFSVTYEISGPRLRTTSCLMNAVDALKILALGDWEAKVPDGTEYKLSSYPEVSILVNTPRRKRTIQARCVIWAIMMGVEEMIVRNRFEFAQFEMRWDGVVLGWVHVVDNAAGGGLRVGTGRRVDEEKRSAAVLPLNATTMGNGANITNPITTDAANDPAEARLTTIFTPTGTTLGIYDIFLPIMNSLSDMAAYPSTHRSQGLIAGYDGRNGLICILPVVAVEYQWLIRALARIPAYMLGEGRFGELRIVMSLDGAEIAMGTVSGLEGCGWEG